MTLALARDPVEEALKRLEHYLDGNRTQSFLLRGGTPLKRRSFLAAGLELGRAGGAACVLREWPALGEEELTQAVHEDCATLSRELAVGATERFFVAEMLAVCAGRELLESVSYEARERLYALEVYDCWTREAELSSALKVVQDLAEQKGRGAVFLYGEAQRLRDRPRSRDWPLTLLLGAFKHAQSRELTLVLASSWSLGRTLARADPDSGMMFQGAILEP